MLPADCPLASVSRISGNDVQRVPSGHRNSAALWSIIQSSRNREGQVITLLSPWFTLHTPSGLSALSLVQFGNLLWKGHIACSRDSTSLCLSYCRQESQTLLLLDCSPTSCFFSILYGTKVQNLISSTKHSS